MKKSNIVIMAAMVIIAWTSNSYAAEILGYPVVAKQAKFYSIILGVIAASVAMVSFSYLCFWLADLKKRARTPKSAESKAFARELAVAAHSAK